MARPSSGAVAWEVPAPRKRLHQPKTVPRQGEGLLGKGEALRYGKGSSPRWNGELAYREGGETKRVQKDVSWWMPAQGMDVIALVGNALVALPVRVVMAWGAAILRDRVPLCSDEDSPTPLTLSEFTSLPAPPAKTPDFLGR
ncbi:unnamed protein product [Bubo scandiacus]